MGKVINGIVIDDDLFQEYHKFQKVKDSTKRKSGSYFTIIKKYSFQYQTI